MKKRKFATGGDIPEPMAPSPEPFPSPFPMPGGGGGGIGGDKSAFGGLSRIRDGAQATAQALTAASQNIGSDKGSGGGGLYTFKKGGKVGGASKRADGIAQRGKTRGRYL